MIDNKRKKTFKRIENIKLKKIKDTIEIWASTVTAHGIPNIYRNENVFIKFIWLVFFLLSTTYCWFSIVTLILSYFDHKVLFNLKLIERSPIDFPAVTFCNLNLFDHRYSQKYIDQVLNNNNMSYVNNISQININPNMVKKLIQSSIASDSKLTKENKRKYGFDIDYMLLTCFFDDIPCDSNDFIWIYDYEYGNCFTFNSGRDEAGNKIDIKKITESGSDKSFRLEIFLGDEFAQGAFMYQSGARIAIHNQSKVPDLISEGLDASTNYQTNIGIKRSFISKLDYPYSSCVKNNHLSDAFDSHLYRYMFTELNMSLYSQKKCHQLCLQDFIRKTCGCIDGSLPFIQYTNICYTIDSLSCIDNSKINYYSNNGIRKCSECPLECDSVNYALSITNSRYPTTYYTNYLRYRTNIQSKFNNVSINDNFIQKNIVLINVFYEDLAATFVNEIPEITSDYLFSNIGGNLGLFIGMSLLSFVEFLEIIVQLIFTILSKNNIN